MTAYLGNALSLDEYRDAKNALVASKQLLKEKLSAFEQKAHTRFEHFTNFVLESKQAKIVVRDANPASLRESIQKVGSNPLLLNRALALSPQGPWLLVANAGLSDDDHAPRHRRGAAAALPHRDFQKLRRRRDSNSRYLAVCRLSKAVE